MSAPAGKAGPKAQKKCKVVTQKTKTVPKKTKQQKPRKVRLQKVERQVKTLKAKTRGPKISDTFSTVVTVGRIIGNNDDSLTRQLKVFVNPLLMKNQDSGSTSSPLSIRASQYGLWKIAKLHVYFTPLAGSANVIGTVSFASLEQESGVATAESPDTIKAKYHAEVPIGSRFVWKVPPRMLTGPREGWWNMDSGDDPTNSVGPSISFWTYLKTILALSTATTTSYLGSLFLIEIRCTYLFSNYAPKPNLAIMVNEKITTTQPVTLTNLSDGSLVMTTTDTRLCALLDNDRGPRGPNAQTNGPGEKFWAVSTLVVDTVAASIGPWGWLLKGGWWVIRKIFGAANTTSTYAIYASVEDAAKDSRIYQPVSGTQTLAAGDVYVTQLTQPNVNEAGSTSLGFSPPTPPAPTGSYLPLPQAAGVPGIPPQYTFSDGQYTAATTWSGTQLYLTGVPATKTVSGSNEMFGVENNTMSRANIDRVQIYDFTTTGIIFLGGQNRSGGAIHTAKTLIVALKTATTKAPWLAADATGTNWAMPSWVGFPVPGAGDHFLQMQNSTDRTTHTTPVGVYFLVAYGATNKLVAFWAAPTDVQAEPTSLMTLYNVDAGRAPITAGLNFTTAMTEYSDDDDDAESDISSLFAPDEVDWKFKIEASSSRHLEEELQFWKSKATQLMLEKN
ncbi:capsid protein precursor [Avastrovirus 1]|uniref:Capsid polyprotein VP90 n=3 Tax=Turkey astrovirus 1 TaxID=364370 RepID=CAPSD_TASV1|nr:capsid protein precursor [Turkey astrovirus]Q9JH68.1 RecName: Full=Capsid polyprotein VP90 [Turkey astrovirus 1]CAB95007.1 capsid protein precursor [Avastrovirus 1]